MLHEPEKQLDQTHIVNSCVQSCPVNYHIDGHQKS